jgi:hypothetical protein
MPAPARRKDDVIQIRTSAEAKSNSQPGCGTARSETVGVHVRERPPAG